MVLHAKKSLGQNFLRSRRVIDVMLDAGKIDSHDIVVEAGPGKGVLTEGLLSCARQVIAIEKDPRLILYLRFRFKRELESGKLILVEGDTLEFDPASYDLKPGGYKIVSNIPYYLTGQFFRYFLSHTTAPSAMVIMVQKEVARRIVARDEKESILSVSVKVYGSPKYIETVPAELFTPKPRVDSAVLAIEDISRHSFEHLNEQRFFEILRIGFSQKRKKLLGNLSALVPREALAEIFKNLSLDENVRAEDVPLSKWKALTRVLA